MSKSIEELQARKAELEKAINSAPSWGAAVGVQYEELKVVNAQIEKARAIDDWVEINGGGVVTPDQVEEMERLHPTEEPWDA